jgi:hypothetical protein
MEKQKTSSFVCLLQLRSWQLQTLFDASLEVKSPEELTLNGFFEY